MAVRTMLYAVATITPETMEASVATPDAVMDWPDALLLAQNQTARPASRNPLDYCPGYVFALIDGDPCANCRQAKAQHREFRS